MKVEKNPNSEKNGRAANEDPSELRDSVKEEKTEEKEEGQPQPQRTQNIT